MKRQTKILAVLTMSLALTTPPSFAVKAGQSSKISTGIVENIQRVEVASKAPKGALVGGALGLLSGGGKSDKKKARNALIGAGAGAAVANRSQGSRRAANYTVRTGENSVIRVVTDQTEIRIGDCVIVEESGKTANVRRVTPTMCESASAKAVAELEDSFQQEANQCHDAKQQLVEATTSDDIDLAMRKMDILCSD